MRRDLTIAIVLLLVAVLLFAAAYHTSAQTGPIQYFAPSPGTTVTNCGTPTSGFPLCGVATGWYIWNGTTWVQLGMVVAGGIQSITVCNASGSTCNPPSLGPGVQLNLATKATSTTTTTIQ